MNLTDHYRQQLDENIAHTREQMIYAVCGDKAAMDELDRDFDVWSDVDLEALGKLLSDIALLRRKATLPFSSEQQYLDHLKNLRELAHKRQAVAELIEAPWFDRILNYTDIRLSQEDLQALRNRQSGGAA